MDLSYKVLSDIEHQLGDSWYLLDLEKFKKNYCEFKNAFVRIYPDTLISYSYKTNYIPSLCKIINEEGGYAEVVSEMEYDLAVKLGVDPLTIIVNGPYKPERALEKFLLSGSTVNLDSYTEASVLFNLAQKFPDKFFNVGLRCNFEFSGLPISRFGFDIENLEFYNLVNKFHSIKNVIFKNLHCHFPNRELMLFGERTEKMLSLYKKIVHNGEPSQIDIGGGLGGKLDEFVKNQLDYDVADYQDYANVIGTRFHNEFQHQPNKPILLLEPGTALVADTLKFVCKIVEIKKIRNQYIAITSGSKLNFHPMASKIFLPMHVFGNMEGKRDFYESIDISGYTCMEADYLYKNYSGYLNVGDFVIFDNVGSYSIVFKPPFILPNVPVISLNSGKLEIHKVAEDFNYIFQTYNFESRV